MKGSGPQVMAKDMMYQKTVIRTRISPTFGELTQEYSPVTSTDVGIETISVNCDNGSNTRQTDTH